jgi:hypothetical protein
MHCLQTLSAGNSGRLLVTSVKSANLLVVTSYGGQIFVIPLAFKLIVVNTLIISWPNHVLQRGPTVPR